MNPDSPILDYDKPSAGLPLPGGSGLPPPGYFYYWPTVNALTPTVVSTPISGDLVSLDSQPIYQLPADSIVEVSIAGRGASQWKRTQDSSSPATNVNAGIIVPVSYDAAARPFTLIRVAGY